MRHGYGTDGAGVIQWNSIAKLRADTYVHGTVHQELRVLEFVEAKGSLSEKRQQVISDDEVKITNLQRIIDDATVRAILKIIGTDYTQSANGEAWLVGVWQRVLEIIIDGQYKGEKFTVDKNINTTAQRQQFINEIIAEVCPPQSGGTLPASADGASAGASTSESAGTGTGGISSGPAKGSGSGAGKAQPTKNRKGLIPKGFAPSGLKPQKIVNICDELKKLEVQSFPHCTGAMFRVLVEFGVETYIKNNPTIQPKNDKLVSKITAVASHMQSNKVLTNKELKPVRDIISKASHPISTETLNAYVHNQHVSPNADTLKTEWDNIQHFMALLWHK